MTMHMKQRRKKAAVRRHQAQRRATVRYFICTYGPYLLRYNTRTGQPVYLWLRKTSGQLPVMVDYQNRVVDSYMANTKSGWREVPYVGWTDQEIPDKLLWLPEGI